VFNATSLAQDCGPSATRVRTVAYGNLQHPNDGARADYRLVVLHNGIKFRREHQPGGSPSSR
jgi:hypothetical protein